MSTESNKQLVRDTWGAVSAGDIDTFMNNLADDISWTFFGSHRFAGTFNGKEELANKLFAPIGDVLEDGIKVELLSLTADGDRVAVEAKGNARSKAGKDYNNDYCMIVTCADGKVKAVREYLDSELVTDVFGK
ncbi:MAG: nuclear transport factor 2 family protein [Gammaproteobacteria bacterium]